MLFFGEVIFSRLIELVLLKLVLILWKFPKKKTTIQLNVKRILWLSFCFCCTHSGSPTSSIVVYVNFKHPWIFCKKKLFISTSSMWLISFIGFACFVLSISVRLCCMWQNWTFFRAKIVSENIKWFFLLLLSLLQPWCHSQIATIVNSC